MLHTIFGLPTHVLLIHVVVVLVPLAALFTGLSAVWPAARHKLGFISPLTSLIALIFVPITVSAGSWLKNQLHYSGALEARIQHHANLAGGFGWYALGLFVVSAAVWWVGRTYEFGVISHGARTANAEPDGAAGAVATRTQTATRLPTLWATVLIVVSVAMSLLIVWQLYRIGDAGAHAVWDGVVR
jgi:hypothetical protein